MLYEPDEEKGVQERKKKGRIVKGLEKKGKKREERKWKGRDLWGKACFQTYIKYQKMKMYKKFTQASIRFHRN